MPIDALSYQGFVGDTRLSESKVEETKRREELIGCFLQKTLHKKYQVSNICDKTLYLTYGKLIVRTCEIETASTALSPDAWAKEAITTCRGVIGPVVDHIMDGTRRMHIFTISSYNLIPHGVSQRLV